MRSDLYLMDELTEDELYQMAKDKLANIKNEDGVDPSSEAVVLYCTYEDDDESPDPSDAVFVAWYDFDDGGSWFCPNPKDNEYYLEIDETIYKPYEIKALPIRLRPAITDYEDGSVTFVDDE